jgi:hypothetical protein
MQLTPVFLLASWSPFHSFNYREHLWSPPGSSMYLRVTNITSFVCLKGSPWETTCVLFILYRSQNSFLTPSLRGFFFFFYIMWFGDDLQCKHVSQHVFTKTSVDWEHYRLQNTYRNFTWVWLILLWRWGDDRLKAKYVTNHINYKYGYCSS